MHYVVDVKMDFLRFLTIILTHLLLQEDLQQGIRIMKYSLNHQWKFRSFRQAFFVGLCQAMMAIVVETATCLVLLFQSHSLFHVLANYIIVIVISEFDENFYSINSDARNKRKITDEKYEELRKIEVTTSWSADHKVEGNRLELEDILSPNEVSLRP